MCMLLGMSKQLVYAFPGFYNKETICSNTCPSEVTAPSPISDTISSQNRYRASKSLRLILERDAKGSLKPKTLTQ